MRLWNLLRIAVIVAAYSCPASLLAAEAPAGADEQARVAESSTTPPDATSGATASAAEPAANTVPADAAAQPSAPPAAPAGAAAADAEPEQRSSLDKKLAEAKKQRRTMEREGETYYCKKEPLIGSRLPKWVCLTEAQLADQIRTNEDVVDRRRLPRPCAGTTTSCTNN